jgi:transposase
MPDLIAIDELLEDIEKARADKDTPPWVSVLLRTVLLLVSALQARTAELEARNEELTRQIYGQRSERSKTRSKQPRQRSKQARKKPKPRKGTSALDETEMEEREEVHEVPQADKCCELCGGTAFNDLEVTEDSTVYKYVSAKLVRVRHRRRKCRCRNGCTLVTAPPPPAVLRGGRFDASLYAAIMVSRSFDAMPLHRQAEAFARAGFPLSASTICDLFHTGAEVLRPLYAVMLDEIRQADVVKADETPQPVLADGKTRRSYVWTFVTDTHTAFVHSASRSGDTPRKLLEGTHGVLLADGYSGYNKVEGPDSRTRAGCMAHARRKFVDAESQAPDDVMWIIQRIGDLYAIERQAAELGVAGTAEHLKIRQQTSALIIEDIREWLAIKKDEARPKSQFGKALGYLDKQMQRLTVFLTDPRVPLDNNEAERALRRIALARKSSFFVGYDASGQRYAIVLSFVVSCRQHGVDAAAYLTDVLPRLPQTAPEDLPALLPSRWAAAA